MIRWLKRLINGAAPAPQRELGNVIVTDWDVALRVEEEERPAREPGRIEYRFLGVTGEEEE